ncbi:hypothetical protein [Verrucomicrobium sp. BvORR034]|uniref:hypothetical protein n=1 Tax=Verrucomicrobium sp. BvORR034 TaxID=1396418 RepID=UPI002240F178|nr:hypothetical protein [Verrucomicrobium sp. BvORR034]
MVAFPHAMSALLSARPLVAALLLCGSALLPAQSNPADDPLAPWRTGVRIRPVSPDKERHTVHSYFNTCPESPDGSKVLFFVSTAPDGHSGEVWIRDRKTGEERRLGNPLKAEDAHRVACQQWVNGGRTVTYHGERDGRWFVAAVNVDDSPPVERILAQDRLSGWGQPQGQVVPLYGQHWNPGPHRNLELVNVVTGEITTALKVEDVTRQYPEWFSKAYAGKEVSIFFPVLSPKLDRVFFKMAAASGPDPRSGAASVRQGLICYDLKNQRFLYQNERWGHPSWHPDDRHIVETAFTIFDSDNGKATRTPGLPAARGDHPSASPDGRLLVTDTTMDRFGSDSNHWGIILADARGGQHLMLHQFKNDEGARSWRRSHPHPIFSPDGKRIYFNISEGPWTRLYVAEITSAQP